MLCLRMEEAPGFLLLRKGLEADLVFLRSLQQPGPNHFEFHAALVIKNYQRIERPHLMPNRAQPHASWRQVEIVRQFVKRYAGSINTANSHRQYSLDAILPTPV